MSGLFEDVDSRYFVLVNSEEQYSLWPSSLEVPDGWTVTYGAAIREECLEFVEEQWVDMRPRSLRDAMSASDNVST
ncbi:MbtH family protein [Microbispora sp. NPDC088329]|uniref:MbtH family protein n=1 Tax=Microbispora sp. NPDC088329 TaxID=3154869 RepID=UPI00342C88B9